MNPLDVTRCAPHHAAPADVRRDGLEPSSERIPASTLRTAGQARKARSFACRSSSIGSGRATARPSAADQEERGGRSSPRTRTQRGGRATPDVRPVNKAIASTRISVARRMRHVAASIGTPAAGHSGHGPITMPIPMGMISRISKRTSPTIRSFRATTLTVAPADWRRGIPGTWRVPAHIWDSFEPYRDARGGLVQTPDG